MDHKMRILPPLNAYFLQRRAYEHHRKKIQLIRSTVVGTQTRNTKHSEQKNEQDADKKEKTSMKYQIHTIKQEIKNELNGRLSPWAKRQRQQAQKQNDRLLNRIRKCSSTINRIQIQKHRIKNQEIKQRLSRFIFNPSSHKTLMKCKHSLQILRQKGKRKDETDHNSRSRYSKSQLSHFSKYRGSERLNTEIIGDKKSNLDRFYLLKNRSKIKSHFEKKGQTTTFSNKDLYSSQTNSRRRLSVSIKTLKNNYFATEIGS